jgi:hypothetical protein
MGKPRLGSLDTQQLIDLGQDRRDLRLDGTDRPVDRETGQAQPALRILPDQAAGGNIERSRSSSLLHDAEDSGCDSAGAAVGARWRSRREQATLRRKG